MLIDDLAGIVGARRVISTPAEMEPHVTEWRGLWEGKAAAVVQPADTAEVSRVLAYCNERGIGVVPQGGNTGLVGGGVPRDDGRSWVVLSTSRFVEIGEAARSRIGASSVVLSQLEIPFDIVDEVILVDDRSADDTLEVAEALGIEHVIEHQVNLGYGGNQKTCFDAALGLGADIVVILHPDYQYTPKLVRAMAGVLAEDVYDIVLGSRILGKNGSWRLGARRSTLPFRPAGADSAVETVFPPGVFITTTPRRAALTIISVGQP